MSDDTPEERDAGHYAFEGKVIRLVGADLDRWRSVFGRIDVLAELEVYDAYLVTQGVGKNWFHRTAAHLRNRNQEARQSSKPREPTLAEIAQSAVV